MTFDPATANPLHGNPLTTRADVERALGDLFAPLLPHFSPGSARVRLDASAALFDRTAADLEGFARPLWGLAPLAAGSGSFEHWNRYGEGLANGTDPAHPEFWGAVRSRDQRLVELAAIGFTLALVPHLAWQPLPDAAKQSVAAYLLAARQCQFHSNNWLFFKSLIELGLEQCGIPFKRSSPPTIEELESFYVGDGWYRDGHTRQMDHYVAFAMHYYGLIYSALSRDAERSQKYRERARLFAQDYRYWFDEDGGVLAFGRSLTYRFAVAGFWGALAYAGVEALPWGEIKGHYMRHLRWWRDKPIAHRDGVLSVGFGYPNLIMSESYNSAGSPYWAFKAFLPLALPATHPFWSAEELPATKTSEPRPMRHPGMVMMQTAGNVVALASGQQNERLRFGPEKYAKFAYSSRYAFSVEADERGLSAATFDNMLGLSDDGRHYRVREHNELAKIAGNNLYALWRPWPDVQVETWLIPMAPWHIRMHRVTTNRQLQSLEGGFAIERADTQTDQADTAPGRAVVRSAADISAIFDLDGLRNARIQRASPNTNLITARTIVPQLGCTIPKGTTVLRAAVFALPLGEDATAALAHPPEAPTFAALQQLFTATAVMVTATLV